MPDTGVRVHAPWAFAVRRWQAPSGKWLYLLHGRSGGAAVTLDLEYDEIVALNEVTGQHVRPE